MAEQRAFVGYGDGVEQRAPDEDETIGRIIASMTRESQTTTERYGRAVRASHAKSTGLLKGELRVLEGLPGFLRHGLFAEARTYPAVVRLAQRPGELLSDSVSTHRGMAIKVFGAGGPKLAGHEDAETQDFVLATGPAFPQADAASFLLAMRALEAGTPMPEAVKQAVSTAARVAQNAIKAVGGDPAGARLGGAPPARLPDARPLANLRGAFRLPPRTQRHAGARAAFDRRGAGLKPAPPALGPPGGAGRRGPPPRRVQPAGARGPAAHPAVAPSGRGRRNARRPSKAATIW